MVYVSELKVTCILLQIAVWFIVKTSIYKEVTINSMTTLLQVFLIIQLVYVLNQQQQPIHFF